MNHTEALNLILAHCCRSTWDDDGVTTFRLEAHCAEIIVTARLTSTKDTNQYDIETVEVQT